MTSDRDDLKLGKCCICEGTANVRNILMLDVRSPEPGPGCWSCLQCGLPEAGAVAVLCDRCVEIKAEVKYICLGYAGENRRAPIAEASEPFMHDMAKHPVRPRPVGWGWEVR